MDVTGIVFIVVVFGLPIGGWITLRVLQHRERMAMLQQGIVPPPRGFGRREWHEAWQARHGRGPGGPWAAPPPVPAPFDAECAQYSLRRGIVTTMVGFALLIGLSFIGWHGGPFGPTIHPGPWLLGGLIPMFVGIAQILIALLSGAQLRFGAPPPPYAGPIPSQPSAEPGRPAPTYEELARPVPPPDRR